MNNMNTQFSQTVGILLLTTNIFLTSCSGDKQEKELKKNNPISVEVGIPTHQSGETISVSGRIESHETAAISTRMMGFISRINVKPGDVVEKGQLLVTINNGDILAKRAQAQAMISETAAALKDAQKDYERFEELYNQKSASTKEFENATLRYNSIKAKAEAAQQMKNETDAMLAYSNLVAPFTGVITQKNSNEGSMANPGMPILMMEQSDEYHVRASVSESEVGQLKKGMNAEVIVKSTGKIIRGKISEISPSSQFTGGQFQLKIIIPSTENTGLFSGMYVNVNIPLKNTSGVQSLSVPASAIIHKDQLSGLYTVSDNQTAQLRWLKVGKEYGNQVEILSGLNSDERFIIKSDSKLYSGALVSVKKSIDLTIAK
jgi:RND family efflux transporter MFP subunit